MDFDVVIIGAGPGGYVTAIRASQLGLKTAIVERENLGGVCLNWGCIPTKALLKSGEVYEQLGHLGDYGLSAGERSYDFAKVIDRSRKVAKQLNSGVAFLMKKHKVEVIMGEARLEKGSPAPKVIVGDRTITAKHVVLATGARAKTIPAIGLEPDGERVWTYREAMVPKAAPKSLIVIGSGAIGIEFASFYRALGAEVTVIEMMDRVLPVEDEEVSKAAQKAFEKRGLKFRLSAKVNKLTKSKSGVTVELEGEKLEAEVAIVAVGITGNVEDLGLEALGVKVDRGHVVIDAHGKTNVPGLYAIGDIAGPPWLAHKASHEGVHCVEAIAGFASPNLHVFRPADRLRRPHRSRGQGSRSRGQGRPLPVQRQRQGDRFRRDDRVREDGVRRQDRRAHRRPHDRGRGHRDDPGLCAGHHSGGDRGGPDGHRLPAPDDERGHARGLARRLRPGSPRLAAAAYP